MELLIIRHATAESKSASGADQDRELTTDGRGQAERAGVKLVERNLVPDLILASPYVRAQQTAQIISEVCSGVEVITAPWAASGMGTEGALEQLRDYKEFASVAIVGHEPDLSSLVCHLMGARSWAVEVNPATAALVGLNASLTAGALRALMQTPVSYARS